MRISNELGTSDITQDRSLLGNDVYDRLLSDIVSQKFAPGSRLLVEALGREFGVSQTPIRQALARLQAAGLVVNKPNAGFSVAPLPGKDWFLASLQYRQIVEPAAAKLAAENITNSQRDELLVVLDELESCKSGGHNSYGKFAAIDVTFHGLIAKFSGNELIVSSLEDVRRRMIVFRMTFPEKLRLSLQDDHRAIYKAIADENAPEAYEAMYAHLTSAIAWLDAA